MWSLLFGADEARYYNTKSEAARPELLARRTHKMSSALSPMDAMAHEAHKANVLVKNNYCGRLEPDTGYVFPPDRACMVESTWSQNTWHESCEEQWRRWNEACSYYNGHVCQGYKNLWDSQFLECPAYTRRPDEKCYECSGYGDPECETQWD